MAGTSSGVGGVKDGRGVEPDVAALRQAGVRPAAGDEGGDIGFGDAAVAVRAGGDQQRSIVCVDGVEMDAQGEHPIKQGLRRRDVLNAGLERPGAEARCADAGAYGDGAVLMPAERPVGYGAFVEEDGAYRFCGRALMGGGVAADRAGGAEHAGEGGQAGETQTGLAGRQI